MVLRSPASIAIASMLAIAMTTACSTSNSVAQRGVGPRPRIPAYDGQPMTTRREIDVYVEGGPTIKQANLARVQAGAAMRLRGGPSWDGTITIDTAIGLGMQRADNSTVNPPRGLGIGIGATIRKSAFDGPFRLGMLVGGQAWRVPINDEEMNSGAAVAPAAFGALIPSVRFGSVVAFLGLSLQLAVAIPDSHPADENVQATSTLGFAANIGVRTDLADHLWLSVSAGLGVNEEHGSFGGALAIGYGLE